MSENEQNNGEKLGKEANNYAKFTGLGVQMAVIIGGLTYAGYKIDQSNGHKTNWVAAIFALSGIFISLYLVIKSVKS